LREKEKWYKIVDIEECKIANQKVNEILKETREFFKNPSGRAFHVKKKTGTLRYAVIRAAKTSSISFILNEDSPNLQETTKKIREFAEKTTADNVVIGHVPSVRDVSVSNEFLVVKGSEFLIEKYLTQEFKFSVQGFFQNNSIMADRMQGYVYLMLREKKLKNYHLLDLYGGVGTFGIINAGLFSKVTIVENDQNCINSAKENIKENKVGNAQALAMDAKNLKKLNLPKDLVVITDPPRSGMHPKTIEDLNRIKPKFIIYISCNPAQLKDDLPKFKNYDIKSVAMFDLFPQTPHIESVVELELSQWA
jgi:tRNA/tmRNA/rRNA uracil-C5-methylase (TrmA/RlmC/RlmD family)